MTRKATARARINVALVKYWGKRDYGLNLPATGSISVTLSDTGTTTKITFDSNFHTDRLVLNGKEQHGQRLARVTHFLNIFRNIAGINGFAEIISFNDVPIDSGLASSASAFAALGLAAARALELDIDLKTLAGLVRMGSGSAARSLFGGFVEVVPGSRLDGSDYLVKQIAPPEHMELAVAIVVCGREAKPISSREGMEHTRLTSPFYAAWLSQVSQDIEKARHAIVSRDLDALGRIAEIQAFRMHAVALSAAPPILYFTDVTLRVLKKLSEIRKSGIPCYTTMDAGPHVFVLCRPEDIGVVSECLAEVEGVEKVIEERPGPGAELME